MGSCPEENYIGIANVAVENANNFILEILIAAFKRLSSFERAARERIYFIRLAKDGCFTIWETYDGRISNESVPMRAAGTIENGVLIGRDGELYLAHGGHAVLDFARGRREVPAGSFAAFENNILARKIKCDELGARYLHVIFPDKQSVVLDRLPFLNPICLGLLYQEKCHLAARHILNLTSILRQANQDVFKKTDTHLNDYGMSIAAASIVAKTSGQDEQVALRRLLAAPTKIEVINGDLGSKLAPTARSETKTIVNDWPTRFFSNGITAGNDGIADIHLSERSLTNERLVWFGDSFGRGCVRLLSLFYREIIFLRTRFFHNEVVCQLRPDVVITQNVERYMDAVAYDSQAPTFLSYSQMKGNTQAAAEDFHAALLGLMERSHRQKSE